MISEHLEILMNDADVVRVLRVLVVYMMLYDTRQLFMIYIGGWMKNEFLGFKKNINYIRKKVWFDTTLQKNS